MGPLTRFVFTGKKNLMNCNPWPYHAPRCPVFLPTPSRSIALTQNFSAEQKLELLQTVSLSTTRDREEERSFLERAENFLDHIEEQRDRDREELQKIRDGEMQVDEEEEQLPTPPPVQVEEVEEEVWEPSEPPPPSESPPPPVPPPNRPKLPLDLSLAIQGSSPSASLSPPPFTSDRSAPAAAGKVLVPVRVDSPDVDLLDPTRRSLMRQISAEERRLRKVRTSDRSRPYIPDDIEIYFRAEGTERDKVLGPGGRPSASWRTQEEEERLERERLRSLEEERERQRREEEEVMRELRRRRRYRTTTIMRMRVSTND